MTEVPLSIYNSLSIYKYVERCDLYSTLYSWCDLLLNFPKCRLKKQAEIHRLLNPDVAIKVFLQMYQ